MGRDMHIAAKWRELALRHGTRAAIIDEHGTWSYRAFQSRITRFGNALAGLGLRRGDRVALLVPDMREYLEADYAIMSAGFVRVPLDPRLTRAELAALLRYAGASALVTHASFAPATDRLVEDVEGLGHIITIGGGGASTTRRAAAVVRPAAAGRRRRRAREPHSAAAPPARRRRPCCGTGTWRRSHAMPSTASASPATAFFSTCGRLADRAGDPDVAPVRRSDGAAAPVRSGNIRSARARGRRDQHLAGADPAGALPDHLRTRQAARTPAGIHVGGSRIAPAVFERALTLIGPRIGVLYGLTEAPVTCYLPPRALEPEAVRGRLIHSVGRVLDEYEVRIADADENAPVGSGRAGEVLIRGGNVMAGYWRDEAATGAALRHGWLHTGDVGEFDDGGNLHIVGRLKEVIRSGSSSIVPKEVEDVIVLHPPSPKSR
jgi:acyl-CoA synthetase (AMP-forming)/AMP-acid ligase II